MTEREELYTGLSHAAWGYFFLIIDFNLGPVSILPRFVGWLLALSAIGKLSGQRRELGLLRPLVIMMIAWSGADWLASWLGGSVEGHILPLDMLATVAALYFHFQFLTDLAALAEKYQPGESDLDRRLLRHRTAYTLLFTVFTLAGEMSQAIPWDGWEWTILGEGIAGVVIALLIMANLFELRQCFRQ